MNQDILESEIEALTTYLLRQAEASDWTVTDQARHAFQTLASAWFHTEPANTIYHDDLHLPIGRSQLHDQLHQAFQEAYGEETRLALNIELNLTCRQAVADY